MRILLLCGLLLALIVMALPVLGEETNTIGGIFIRDFQISNNGVTIFSDDFNKDELQGWSPINSGIWTVDNPSEQGKFCLYLNREIDENAGISRELEIDKVGTLEISAWVYLPAPEQQWSYTHNATARTRIDFETSKGDHSFYVPITLNPGENGYRIGLVWFKPELKEFGKEVEKYESDKVVITPKKWTLVTLKLNRSTKIATVAVDGKTQVTCEYNPNKMKTLSYVNMTTWMGNQRRGGEETAVYAKSVKIRPRYVPRRRATGG